MDVKAFQAQLFERGRAVGFGDMEIYYQADRSTTVRVFKGDLDAYLIAEKAGLSFRGEIGGRMGYAFTEKIDADSIDLLLEQARDNAAVIESEQLEDLFAGSEQYAELNLYSQPLAQVTPDQWIGVAKQMEQVALQSDPRIDLVNSCSVVFTENELTIINTKGLNCHSQSNASVCMISVVAKEEGDITSASETAYSMSDLAELRSEEVARRAGEEAALKLKGQTIESGSYPIVLRNDVAASLLQAFSGIFSGEKAEKGLSLLQGKIGTLVAGENITIIDDPHRLDGPGSTPFDSEGMATSRHEVIRDGKLLTFLHNRKSAQAAGVESTGNAYKASYRAAVSIQPNNLYIEAGEQTLDEMIAGMERGILIVELQGLHSGTNSVSGDFSLFCIGHLIEGGKVVRPVNQITVSGNFLELLTRVEGIGNDLRFRGLGRGACGSPSLKIQSLAIAGK